MRHRINQKEASYIVEVLSANLEKMQAKQTRIKQLELEILLLGKEILRGNTWATVPARKQKRLELEELKKQSYPLFEHLTTHEKLIRKYSAIANGTTSQGFFKKINNSINFFLHSETKTPLKELI
jgi:hypothetical protein